MSNSERRGGFINERFSRRKMLAGALGLGAGIAVPYSQGVSPSEVIDILSVGYEYGPDVAQALLTNPGQSLEAYSLWRKPERKYEDLHFFEEKLVYREGTPNAVIGFGDSNLEGAEGNGRKWRKSPIHLYRTMAQERYGFSEWEDFNCAQSGYTTEMVKEMQLIDPKAEDGFNFSPRCDVWINVGGNDASALVSTIEEVDELRRLAQNPFGDMSLLLKYTDKILDNISEFGERFGDLLSSIQYLYGERIRQYVIMSAPDFGKVESIVTQVIDGNPHNVPIENSAVSRLVENVAIRMNNTMFDAAYKFQRDGGSRIVGIDTSKPSFSHFAGDQHFSEEACYEIALHALDRVEVRTA